MPSQVVAPSFTQFAYPAYWSANFTGCSWVQKPCLDPLPASQQCLFFLVRARTQTHTQTAVPVLRTRHSPVRQCSNGTVACPPPEIPPCPGYDHFPFLCDPDESGVRPFQVSVCFIVSSAPAADFDPTWCGLPHRSITATP